MRRIRSIAVLRTWLVPLWLLTVFAGMGVLIDYETRPGSSTPAPSHWPEASQIPRDGRLAQLVMFVHPRCPCSRASIRELAVLMARCRGRAACHVLLLKPKEFDPEWARTDLWQSAVAIPGVTVMLDEDGGMRQRVQISEISPNVFLAPLHCWLHSMN